MGAARVRDKPKGLLGHGGEGPQVGDVPQSKDTCGKKKELALTMDEIGKFSILYL